jgi:hypothetical protein
MADDEPAREQPEIILPEKHIGGVWANYAQVSHSQHEFTIDFVRIDATAPAPGRGIVVARVSMSPLFVTQLIDALQKNWSGYAQKALPQELRGEIASEGEGEGGREGEGGNGPVGEGENVSAGEREGGPEGEGEGENEGERESEPEDEGGSAPVGEPESGSEEEREDVG